MRLNQALQLLAAQAQSIHSQFNVKRLSLFGSLARDQAKPDSDVDVLVEFENRPSFDGFMELKFFLESVLDKRVDLVTLGALKPRMRRLIENELIHAA